LVANNRDTKRIGVRKIKTDPMDLTAKVEFAIDDSNNVQHHMQIHYALIGNQLITDLLIEIESKIYNFIDALYTGEFPSPVSICGLIITTINQQRLLLAYFCLNSIPSLFLE
jgi:hypothetical protein